MLRADLMIGAAHGTLELAPEAVNGLGMDRAFHELPRRVLDALMDKAQRLGLVVEVALVGREHGARSAEARQQRQDDGRAGLRQHLGTDAPATLYHAEHWRLAVGPEPSLAVTLTADIGLVGFKDAREKAIVLGHEQANLTRHAPRALIGHAELARQLHGRHAILGGGEQEYGVEPKRQRRRGLVENRPRAGREERPTRALVGPPPPDGVEAVGLPALRALGPFRAPHGEDVSETRRVVGELRLEGFDGVFHLGGSHSSAIPSVASGRLFHAFISAAGPIAPQYSDPPGYWTLDKQTTLGTSDLVSTLRFFPPQNGQDLNCVFISPSEVDVHLSTYALRLFLGIARAADSTIPLLSLALDNLNSANVPLSHIGPRRRSVVSDDLQQIPNIDFVFHAQSIADKQYVVKG